MAKAELKDMAGLSYRSNSARLPHPTVLSDWTLRGLIEIDVDFDCFRLTAAGREHLAQEASK